MRTHITPVQLFLLIFLYAFSGLTLADADSVFSLILSPLAIGLWACIGCHGAKRRCENFPDLLSAYLPKRETVIPYAVFLSMSAAEATLLLVTLAESVRMRMDFLSFPLIAAVLFGIAFLIASKGATVLGRVAELSLFLLAPLLVLHAFGELSPIAVYGNTSVFRMLFHAMPSPIFYLLSVTTVSGDAHISGGFRMSAKPPKNRAGFLLKTCISAALAASLFRAMLLLLPFEEASLLLRFFELTAHVVKLAVLFSVLASSFSLSNRRHAWVCTSLVACIAVLTSAILGGAIFSPFLLMLMLVCLGAVVCGMLGIFGFLFPLS